MMPILYTLRYNLIEIFMYSRYIYILTKTDTLYTLAINHTATCCAGTQSYTPNIHLLPFAVHTILSCVSFALILI